MCFHPKEATPASAVICSWSFWLFWIFPSNLNSHPSFVPASNAAFPHACALKASFALQKFHIFVPSLPPLLEFLYCWSKCSFPFQENLPPCQAAKGEKSLSCSLLDRISVQFPHSEWQDLGWTYCKNSKTSKEELWSGIQKWKEKSLVQSTQTGWLETLPDSLPWL